MMFSQDTTQRTPKEDTHKKKRVIDNHTRNTTNETPKKKQRKNSFTERKEEKTSNEYGDNENENEEAEEKRERRTEEMTWEMRERQQALISEKVDKERRRLEVEEKSTTSANQELYQLYNELQGISHE